jgi:hypothetical protein
MQEINEAYEILSNFGKKDAYYSVWLQKTAINRNMPKPVGTHYPGSNPEPAPKPKAEPQLIKFYGVKPGEIRKGSFIVRDTGGRYDRFSLSTPDSWIKIIDHSPNVGTSKQPRIVDFEINPQDWGRNYEGRIVFMLDDKMTIVKVEFLTQVEPFQAKINSRSGIDYVTWTVQRAFSPGLPIRYLS